MSDSEVKPARPASDGSQQRQRARKGGQHRRHTLPLNGWLILDKRAGQTSTQAVGILKKLFQAEKAGHAGTLDPLATGILPIAFGEATKTVPFVVDGAKSYRFTVKWGAQTDTDDADGKVIAENPARPTQAAIEAALPAFTGRIAQTPPQFSAVKVAGERAYDLARDGETVALAPREVHITRLSLIEMLGPDSCVLEADCGKGTYVRAIARDLGLTLGCLGHVTALRRLRVGPFAEKDAVLLETLDAAKASDAGRAALLAHVRPVASGLASLPMIAVGNQDAARLKRGQSVLLRGRDAPIIEGPAYATWKGELIALGEIVEGALQPTRVFNLALSRDESV